MTLLGSNPPARSWSCEGPLSAELLRRTLEAIVARHEALRTTFKAVTELCSTHQVLLFTCHPHLIKQVEEIVPAAKVFPLQ